MEQKENKKPGGFLPSITDTTKAPNKVPPGLEIFAGKTFLEVLSLDYTPEQIRKIGGLMYGVNDFGVTLPEFAKIASQQFWKNYLPKGFSPNDSIKDIGILLKIFEQYVPSSKKKTKVQSALIKTRPALIKELSKEIEPASDQEKSEFYSGKVLGEKVHNKLSDPNYLKMVKRAPLYLFIALLWELFESFESQAEADRWFRFEKIIGSNVSSAEVRAVFRTVGLRYRAQGRPKKKKTDATN